MLGSLTGDTFEQKELKLLQLLPKKIGYYFLVFRLDASWANGGMQAVALDKDTELNAKLLQTTIEAFIFFGATSGAALLGKIVPIAIQAAREIDILIQRDATDEDLEPIWARLDACDTHYDDTFTEIYPAILADIHKHPADWQIGAP